MKYDIIIPHMNDHTANRLAQKCLQTIRAYSTQQNVIWIQNGGETPSIIENELTISPCVTRIKNLTNIGFVKAVNQGLAVSKAQFIVLMNNDTEAAPCWLEKLSAPIEEGRCGMSGPRTTTRGSWQGGPWIPNPPQKLDLGSMLAFFCVMMRRDVFVTVGYLDEDFGVGFGDDDNYCARVQAAGYALMFVPEVCIPHNHRTTFKAVYSKEQIQEMQDRALLLHMKKLRDISPPIHKILSAKLADYMRPIRTKYGHEDSSRNSKQGSTPQQDDGVSVPGSMRLYP